MNDIKNKELALLNSEPFFDVELSSKCNANCIMCPRNKLTRKHELMSLDAIKTLSGWFPADAKVMLCGLGEPLLNRNIHFLISSLKARNLEVGITTNGFLLTEDVVKLIVKDGISLIQVSFNGSTEKIYSSIMKNSCFDSVVKNLRYLAKIKPPELTVKLAVTIQEKNKDDIEGIKKFASSLGFEVFLRNIHSRSGALALANTQVNNSAGCGILPKVTFIAANGDVLSCCQDLGGKFILGNVNKNSFEEVVRKKREIIEKDSWFSICKYCDDEYRHVLLSGGVI